MFDVTSGSVFHRVLLFLGVILLAAVVVGCVSTPGSSEGVAVAGAESSAGGDDPTDVESAVDERRSPPDDRLPALPFPEDGEWVNTDEPLTMEALEGRYVLLDFWTYGCINCYHMVPNLNRLQDRYDGRLVVIGVHSAKFTEEQDSQNIREAIERYGIRYPVMNDRNMELWQKYQVPGWPTILVIEPDGYILGGATGEWDFDVVAEVLDARIHEVSEGPLPELPQLSQAATAPEALTRLHFPQGLAYDSIDNLLFISDTGNNRILSVDPDSGTVRNVWGTGVAGLRDGEMMTARFQGPRGIVALDDSIYVADTGNHAIRRIDRRDGTVSTVLQGGIGPTDEIRSPWDVATDGDVVYFSNAGAHQIWFFDPEDGEPAVYSGSGYEGLVDGSPEEAEYAQPSGLSFHQGMLYVADPESSAIRAVDTQSGGAVETLVGAGLFDFGFRDGTVDSARLMHIGDVEYTSAGLVLADTYNNSVRLLLDGLVSTVVTELNEPKALTTDGNRIWVADTNNHRILRTNVTRVASGDGTVDPLPLRPSGGDTGGGNAPLAFRQDITNGALRVQVSLPEGYKLNEESPNTLVFRNIDGDEVALPVASEGQERQTIRVAWADLVREKIVDDDTARQSIAMEAWLYYCLQENEDVCHFFSREYQFLLEATGPEESRREDSRNVPDASVSVIVG